MGPIVRRGPDGVGYRPVVTMTAPHAPAATPPARPRHDRPVAIITGASAGIGAATAVELARTGHDLVLVARRRERLAEVAARASDAAKRLVRTEIVTADVSHAGTATRILDEAERAFGRFDVVYANAGYGLERPMHRMTSDELRAMFETNFFSSTELCNEAARRLIAAGRGGHLLMCSSCVAKFTLPSFGAYSASKAAQAHVARAMAYELRPYGIMVSSVHPVTTATEFFEVVREALEDGEEQQYAIHDLNKFFVQRPEKVARAIARTIGTSRTEIWTSLPTRVAAGMITAFPWLLDIAVRATRRRSTTVQAPSND